MAYNPIAYIKSDKDYNILVDALEQYPLLCFYAAFATEVLLYKLPLIREIRATANLYLWILPTKNSLEVMWLVR